jgi:hypothetical protein
MAAVFGGLAILNKRRFYETSRLADHSSPAAPYLLYSAHCQVAADSCPERST